MTVSFFVVPAKAGTHPAVDTGLRRYDDWVATGRLSKPQAEGTRQ
jgi:hypothetical protein